MNVPARLAAFGFALLAALGVGVGLGRAVGPLGDDSPQHGSTPSHAPRPGVDR